MHGRPFELREVVDVEAAIARAARDHHGACAHGLAVADVERVVVAAHRSSRRSSLASSGITISTPNFCAWL